MIFVPETYGELERISAQLEGDDKAVWDHMMRGIRPATVVPVESETVGQAIRKHRASMECAEALTDVVAESECFEGGI